MVIDGQWKYDAGRNRKLDRAKVEDFKTRFYKFEGYNPDNGYPTRAALDKMGMKKSRMMQRAASCGRMKYGRRLRGRAQHPKL